MTPLRVATLASAAVVALAGRAAAQDAPCALAVEPQNAQLTVGDHLQLSVNATLPDASGACDGERRGVTAEALYNSSIQHVIVNEAGVITASKASTATITVRYRGLAAVTLATAVDRAAPSGVPPAGAPEPTTEQTAKPAATRTVQPPGMPAASAEANARCDAVYVSKFRELDLDAAVIEAELKKPRTNSCFLLADVLDGALDDERRKRLPAATTRPEPKDVKPAMPESVGAQGSAGEVAAVPSVAPTPLAGVTVALAGTEGGPRLVTALGLNPGALVADETKTYAVQSRLADVSVVLPTRLDNDDGDAFEYVGFRVRLNFIAPYAGEQAYEKARALAQAAYARLGVEQAEPLLALTRMLVGASDVRGCYDAVMANDDATIAELCGEAMPDRTALSRSEAEARAALAQVRTAADGTAIGLDLRLNVGDYTASGAKEADHALGTVASANISHRIVGSRQIELRLRGRVGGAYAHVKDEDEIGFDWGVGAEVSSGIAGGGRIRLSAGLEGRVGDRDAPQLTDMQYTDLKLGLGVPTSEGASIGIAAVLPVSGDHAALLTTAGDLSAFLPD